VFNLITGTYEETMPEQPVQYRLDQPAIYEIRVQGALSSRWQNYFENMQISIEGEDGWATTTLCGPVVDQSALQGLVQKLFTLGLVLIYLERKE
jgi:hypothetical protein